MFGETVDKMKDKGTDLTSDIKRKIMLHPSVNADSKVDDSFKTRMLMAGLGGLSTLALSGGISKFIRKIPATNIAAGTALGASSGFFAPDIHNILHEHRKGNLSKEELKQEFRRIGRAEMYAFNKGIETGDFATDYMKKNASAASIVSGGVGGAITSGIKNGIKSGIGGTLKAGFNVAKEIPRGIFHIPKKTDAIGTKVFSYAAKGGAIGAGVAGVAAGAKELQRPRSATNYDTFLRNNVLSGDIKPNELSSSDRQSVHNLGMH